MTGSGRILGWNVILLISSRYVVRYHLCFLGDLWRHGTGPEKLKNMKMVISHINGEGNASADRLPREEVQGFTWWGVEFFVPLLTKDLPTDFFRFD